LIVRYHKPPNKSRKKCKKKEKNLKIKKFRTPAVIFKEYREMHVLAVNLGKICLFGCSGRITLHSEAVFAEKK